MSIGHLLYIPLVGLICIAVGYVMGAKAVRKEIEDMSRRARK
jgi:hypothetical protein